MIENEFPPEFKVDESQIAIDFDGVIHNNNKGWHDGTCYGEPIEGSLKAIKHLWYSGHTIVIFTAKVKPDRPLVDGKTGMELVQEWLDKYGYSKYITEITCEKPRAILYIDDKAYRFENWNDTIEDWDGTEL